MHTHTEERVWLLSLDCLNFTAFLNHWLYQSSTDTMVIDLKATPNQRPLSYYYLGPNIAFTLLLRTTLRLKAKFHSTMMVAVIEGL